MTFHREWFVEFQPYVGKRTVKVANNCNLEIRGIGTILIDARVKNQWEPRRLENVLYVPAIRENLFATAILTDKGAKVLIDRNGCTVYDESIYARRFVRANGRNGSWWLPIFYADKGRGNNIPVYIFTQVKG